MRSIDVVCMGRVAVDLYAQQVYSKLQDAQTFQKYVGGCAGNIAIGCARMGLKVHMLSKVGKDEMGAFVIKTLQKEGVNTDYVFTTADHLTGLVLLGICPPDHFPLMFYRENCADMQLLPSECNLPIWKNTKSVLLTGTGFSQAMIRSTSQSIIHYAKVNQVKVILDLDYRPVLWGAGAKGDGENRYVENDYITSKYKPFLISADLIVGTAEEFLIATGFDNIECAVHYLQNNTHATLVLKQGEKGCTVYPVNGESQIFTGEKIDVLNVLGAGDGFLSGFLRGWINNEPIQACANYANAAGAIVVSRHGCAPAIPFKNELDKYLQSKDKIALLKSLEFNRAHQQCAHKTKGKPMHIFAFDHHQYFEQSNQPAHVIRAFKNLLWQGFCQALKQLPVSIQGIGVLVDDKYANNVLEKLHNNDLAHKLVYGMPSDGNITRKPADAFIKHLCHFSSDMAPNEIAHLIEQVEYIYKSCISNERLFMLEVITTEPARAIQLFYESGIYPTWWKIPAPITENTWAQIERVIDDFDKNASVVILGGDYEQNLTEPFKLASRAKICSGFVIGRTLFHEAWQHYCRQENCDIPKLIADNYLKLIHAWHKYAKQEKKELV